jgi:nitrite reductase/ring-hydroxylating ferredoxin subunit
MMVDTAPSSTLVDAAAEAEVQSAGCVVANLEGHTVALFWDGATVRAVDNRCPHMGFPLHRGSVRDGVLTCHWHHARFDLCGGGTFDQWADDLRSFPVEVRDGRVWVDVAQRGDQAAYRRRRLRVGLERNLSLVIAKSVIALVAEPDGALRSGVEFGVAGRDDGWGQGLTILTCMRNLLPRLSADDRPRALHHGLAAVAGDSQGMAPRYLIAPLPGAEGREPDAIERWLREFVEVRDAEGAERAIVSAVRSGAARERVASMLYAAATDHRYLSIGHVLDFTTKALDALDHLDWEMAEPVLASLASGYANAERSEESSQWRHPVDLVAILEATFERLDETLDAPRGDWTPPPGLTDVLLGEDPQAIADALLAAIAAGADPATVAGEVSYAAALRIARFPVSNEFSDWDTALHSFTFANAVQQGLRRTGSRALVRGVFDAAMSVHLDRFLNVPPARLPEATGSRPVGADELMALLDGQQRVDDAGALVWEWLAGGGDPEQVIAALGHGMLREDRDFHTIQMTEAAAAQHDLLRGGERAHHVLVAAARYLAAHAPTARAQGQTYQIAWRLHRGERLYEAADVTA